MSPIPSRSQPPHLEPVDPQRLEQRFTRRLNELRAALADKPPEWVARAIGASYTERGAQAVASGQIDLSLWNRAIRITWPEWVAYPQGEDQPLSDFDQALLLYHLNVADGAPLSGEWIAFSDLPDGRFYNQAFQGYTGKELARAFRDDRAAFEHAAQALGGQPHPLGDAAFIFEVLPRVPLLVVYWRGDEDLPSTCQVLFDAAASHYLPTDAYAILGSILTRRLISKRSAA